MVVRKKLGMRADPNRNYFLGVSPTRTCLL